MMLLIGDKSVSDISPESTGLIIKWSIGIVTGIISILLAALLKIRGDKTAIIPITEKQLKNELMICKLKVKEELKTEFYDAIHDALEDHKKDMLELIREMNK